MYKLPVIKLLFFRSILLLIIFVNEAVDSSLIYTVSSNYSFANLLVYILIGLQFISAPFQSGFSDFYCRKKSLVVAVVATLIGVILFSFSIFSNNFLFLIISILLLGTLSNLLPLSWAALADIEDPRNFRFALALSICALAVGWWGSLLLLPLISFKNILWINFAIVFLVLILSFFFEDVREEEVKGVSQGSVKLFRLLWDETKGLYALLKKPVNLFTYLSFFLSEISQYQILFRVEAIHTDQFLRYIPLATAIGYTFGTINLRYLTTSDKVASVFGFFSSFISLALIIFFEYLRIDNGVIFGMLFSVYNFGYAIFTPSIFSAIAPKDEPHKMGKLFGILDSFESLAVLSSFILVFIFAALSHRGVFLLSLGFSASCGLLLYLAAKNYTSSSEKYSRK